MSNKNSSALQSKIAELEAEIKHLRRFERRWNTLAKLCPSLDIQIHTDSDVAVQSEHPTEEIVAKWAYVVDGTYPGRYQSTLSRNIKPDRNFRNSPISQAY